MFWRLVVDDAEHLERRTPPRSVLPELAGDFRGSFSGYEPNCLFYAADGAPQRLLQAAYVFGLDHDDDGRAVAPVDVDGDGDLDLALLSLQGLRLLENTSPPRSFARLRLRATRSEAQALGAVARVRAGGATQMDFVKLTDGFQTQVPRDLHFGLNDAREIEELSVRWPSGSEQTWRRLPVDRLIELVEGEQEFRASELPRWPDETRPALPPAASPQLAAARLAGERAPLAPPDRPAVVNFWAPWCAPCRTELPELAALAARFGDQVSFAGVSVEREDLGSVQAAIDQHGLRYPQYVADDELLLAFFGAEGEATLPATFVFDAEGSLRRLFRRALAADELEALLASFQDEQLFAADLRILALKDERRGDWLAALEHHRTLARIEPDDPEHPYNAGVAWTKAGNLIEAERAFRRALERDPEHSRAHYNLGLALRFAGRPLEAIESFAAVVRIEGELYQALLNLGTAAAEAGRVEQALDALARARTAAPAAAAPWVVEGQLLLGLDRVGAARARFERALELAPEEPTARAALGEIRAREKR